MATVVTDPYTEMANVVETAILAEFDDEPYKVVSHDRIHESLGSDGVLHIGLSPTEEATPGQTLAEEMLIQFYGPFIPEVDPSQEFDPRLITNKAERLRRALAQVRTVGSPHLWFFDVISTRYPSDATGNKTRFEMTLQGQGNNSGLRETTG